MKAGFCFTMLTLGAGFCILVLAGPTSSQVPGGWQRPGPNLDEARIAALQRRIRGHAQSLKPDDIAKLSVGSKPLVDALHKPAAAENPKTKPAVPPSSSSNNQRTATSAVKKNQNPAPEHAETAKAADKARQSSFNQPPHGREPRAPALPSGYHPNVSVSAPGRLDWTFVVSRQSLDPAPSAATAGYVSARQSYELHVPSGYNPRQAYPLILQVNTAPRSDGWVHWQKTCQSRRVIFAGVHHAGNDVALAARARTVLDVLDDVRRRFHIDADRTYITGMSGAGHAASNIAFALPELFGGHIAICGAWNLRAEPMLRQRVSERLSVAVLTGAMDFNRPELEREFYPILREHHARAQLWVYPGIGHAYPSPAQLDQVFQWVEAGLPQRRASGALFPASRLAHAATADEWSTAVVLEAGQRLEMPGGEPSGLFLLQGVIERWPGLPAAAVAQKLLAEFDASSPVPWKDVYRAEHLRFRLLQARTFDGIVNGPLPPGYPVPRINLQRIALALWREVHELAQADSPVAKEASARLSVLQQQVGPDA